MDAALFVEVAMSLPQLHLLIKLFIAYIPIATGSTDTGIVVAAMRLPYP